MTKAEKRARKALRAHLTPAQAQEWRQKRKCEYFGTFYRYRRLTVPGTRRRYFLFKIWNIRGGGDENDDYSYVALARNRTAGLDGRRPSPEQMEWACFQVKASDRYPLDDQVLTIKLALEAKETWVVRTANWER